MARKLEPENEVHLSNLTGFDLQQVRKGLDELLMRREDVAEANGTASGVMKTLEREHGLSAGGVRMALGLVKMTEDKRRDVLRSFWACAEALELDVGKPQDMVDMMEAAE